MSKLRPAIADVDLSALDGATLAALEELARKKWQLQMIRAQQEQDRLARELHNTEVPEVNGFRMVRRVHADAFHDWAHKEGGYEVWNDRGFLKYFDKLAPECQVKYQRKAQVGWTESLPEEVPIHTVGSGHKRFVKKYD